MKLVTVKLASHLLNVPLSASATLLPFLLFRPKELKEAEKLSRAAVFVNVCISFKYYPDF